MIYQFTTLLKVLYAIAPKKYILLCYLGGSVEYSNNLKSSM